MTLRTICQVSDAKGTSHHQILIFLIPTQIIVPMHHQNKLAVHISVGIASNYIILGLSCNPDVNLSYINWHFGTVWPWCDAMIHRSQKCQTLGQFFESLYIFISYTFTCVEGLELALWIDLQIPQDDNNEWDERTAMTWQSCCNTRKLGDVDFSHHRSFKQLVQMRIGGLGSIHTAQYKGEYSSPRLFILLTTR